MTKEIYEALKARIAVASKDVVKVYLEDYPDTSKTATCYRFDLTGLDEDIPGIVHSMDTKNIWNVAQRFHSFLRVLEIPDEILLARHVSCK